MLTDEQLLRYSRHLLLNEFTVADQERIASASVLIVGLGGLGCAVGQYLTACGVGHLHISDPDAVELSNLPRQVLYDESMIGQQKATAAKKILSRLNPHLVINAIAQNITPDNIDNLSVDIIVDCSDNFATRHLLNRHSVQRRIPLVSGAALQFGAQLAVFDFRERDSTACYNCVFREQDSAPDAQCLDSGVFAPLVGLVGCLQAAEVIKLLVAQLPLPHNSLLLIDGKNLDFRKVRLKKDPQCIVCNAAE